MIIPEPFTESENLNEVPVATQTPATVREEIHHSPEIINHREEEVRHSADFMNAKSLSKMFRGRTVSPKKKITRIKCTLCQKHFASNSIQQIAQRDFCLPCADQVLQRLNAQPPNHK